MRVLIAEDAPRLAQLLRLGLQDDGHAVDIASTGPGALWLGQENPYDAILLDVMLPGLTGFEVCQRLRAARCTSSCSRPATPSRTGSGAWTWVPTTT